MWVVATRMGYFGKPVPRRRYPADVRHKDAGKPFWVPDEPINDKKGHPDFGRPLAFSSRWMKEVPDPSGTQKAELEAEAAELAAPAEDAPPPVAKRSKKAI